MPFNRQQLLQPWMPTFKIHYPEFDQPHWIVEYVGKDCWMAVTTYPEIQAATVELREFYNRREEIKHVLRFIEERRR